MTGTLGDLYPWAKAAHLIFVIYWMAGLFLLPRYYVYHQEAGVGSPEAERWVDREGKLRRIILTPSLIAVWLLGIALALNWGLTSADSLGPVGWLHVKLLFVIGLTAYHGWLITYGRKLAGGQATLSGKGLRLLNEVPGVAVAVIVVLAIVKPF